MSAEVLMRGILALFFAGMMIWAVYDRDDREALDDSNTRRYTPIFPVMTLPLFVALLMLLSLLGHDPQMQKKAFSLCFSVFLHISVYYLLLLALLPLLRRTIRARSCAILWLLPNYLYLMQQGFMDLPRPLLALPVPTRAARIAGVLWLAGAIAVLGWKFLSHLRFRRRILKAAHPVTDPEILSLWEAEQRAAGFKKAGYRLVVSPEVRTPLSIGFFRNSTRVVLPERPYTSSDLVLIFRHELVHIGREDCWNKFFLAFCTAVCWFNPLMWMAMRRSADDLELSCDEAVLRDAAPEARQSYARLLLRTAGDERGFTTCLSASAKSLRYRLRNVIKPCSRRSGAMLVGVTFFVLIMSCGYVTIAYGSGTGAAYIFSSQDTTAFDLTGTSLKIDGKYSDRRCADPEALNQYLSSLQLEEIAGNYTFSTEKRELALTYRTPDGPRWVNLTEHALMVTNSGAGKTTYLTASPVDWDYIVSLFTAEPTEAPRLMVFLENDEIEGGGWWSDAAARVLACTTDGVPQGVPKVMSGGSGSLGGYDLTGIRLYFLSPGYYPEDPMEIDGVLTPTVCTVQVSDWERTQFETLSPEAGEDALTLPPPPHSAHYTVDATLEVGNTVYEMRYFFDIKLAET